MERYFEGGTERISIGEMAETFKVSQRTLRLYHDMDLLAPQYVDEKTGYRYYSRSQFPRLERILQMKNIGLSLKQIKSMLDERNLSVYEALLNERIDELDEKISQDTASRNLLVKQLNSCARLRNPPAQDAAFIEFIPKRFAFRFEIEAYDLHDDYGGTSPWETAMEKVRDILTRNNLPLSLLQQSCCSITQQNLTKRQYVCDRAFLLTDGPVQTSLPQVIIQSGTYACMYRNYTALDGRSESLGLDKLLQFITDNHYQIVGSYLGEVVAKTSIFDYSNNTIMVKLQIPVKISEQADPLRK